MHVGLYCTAHLKSWWHHQMETFSALVAVCAGNSPIPGEFPAKRPVTQSFDVFFDQRLNKRLSKQWWGWWFKTLSRPLWCHRNVAKTHNRVTVGCKPLRSLRILNQWGITDGRALWKWVDFLFIVGGVGIHNYICSHALNVKYIAKSTW